MKIKNKIKLQAGGGYIKFISVPPTRPLSDIHGFSPIDAYDPSTLLTVDVAHEYTLDMYNEGVTLIGDYLFPGELGFISTGTVLIDKTFKYSTLCTLLNLLNNPILSQDWDTKLIEYLTVNSDEIKRRALVENV